MRATCGKAANWGGKVCIQVLIVDKDAAYRADLERYLALVDVPCTVIGAVGTAREALSSAQRLTPDIVLTDVELPDSSGLVLAQRLQELHPAMAVVVIGLHSDSAYQQAALAAGAIAYVDKVDLGRVLADVLADVFHKSVEQRGCLPAQPDPNQPLVPSPAPQLKGESVTWNR